MREEDGVAIADLIFFAFHNPTRRAAARRAYDEKRWGDLKWITGILKRVVGIPTKMYNKHWDNFIAHIRDHHPRDILDYDEYEELRKVTCAELEVPYAPGIQDVEIFFWIFGFKKKW